MPVATSVKLSVDASGITSGMAKASQAVQAGASKMSASISKMRSGVAAASNSVGGLAKGFITMEIGKKLLRGLYEMTKLNQENVKMYAEMNKSLTQLGTTLASGSVPAVRTLTNLVKETADEWNKFIKTGNFGGTDDPKIEYARNLQIEFDRMTDATNRTSNAWLYYLSLGQLGDTYQKLEMIKAEKKHMEELDETLGLIEFRKQERSKAEILRMQQEQLRRKSFLKDVNDENQKNADKKAADEEDAKWDAEAEQLDAISEAHKKRSDEMGALVEKQYDMSELSAEWVESEEESGNKMIKDQEDKDAADLESFKRTQALEARKTKMRNDRVVAERQSVYDGITAANYGFQTAQVMFGKNKMLATAEAITAGGVAVMNAMKTQPFFPVGLSMAALAGAQTAKSVSQIQAAATGADFTTDGPQLLLVGENPGGKERVSVEPLSSPNINGPQGGGSSSSMPNISVSISASFGGSSGASSRELRDFSETVKSAVRQGYLSARDLK